MKLAIKCPTCGGYVAPIEGYAHATEVADRTCRRCKARWRVIAKPVIRTARAIAHKLDWTCLRSAR